jgi:ubiquinone/menaquinone biosynthesis C-methylase UbiE
VTDRSVGFDRAAGYYDRTRGFTPAAFDALLNVLVAELRGNGPCLEIGVGTGLLALPLAKRGVPMVGADLARPMLDKLTEKAGGDMPFPLLQADATALPFSSGAIGRALLRHVLHLVPDWRGALTELVRVLSPEGRLLIVRSTFHEHLWWDLVERFLQEAGGLPFCVGLDPREAGSASVALEELGAPGLEVATIPDGSEETIAQFLDQVALGMHSWTWQVKEQERRNAVEAVRAWARDRRGSLDAPVAPEYRVVVTRYDLEA